MQFNDIYLYLNYQSSTSTEDQLTQAQSLIANCDKNSVNSIIESDNNSELRNCYLRFKKMIL